MCACSAGQFRLIAQDRPLSPKRRGYGSQKHGPFAAIASEKKDLGIQAIAEGETVMEPAICHGVVRPGPYTLFLQSPCAFECDEDFRPGAGIQNLSRRVVVANPRSEYVCQFRDVQIQGSSGMRFSATSCVISNPTTAEQSTAAVKTGM
jgi:hypothetical protein